MLPARVLWMPVCLTALLALSGCGRLRLPAIDPTGQGIFLPANNYTTIGQPQAKLGELDPLFAAPAAPPPCNQDTAAHGRHEREPLANLLHRPGRADNPLVRRGEPGRLMVEPGRLVAPVGSEVIVTCGLCGPDGYFLIRQPVEWTLSQDSVGNLIDVGGDGRQVLNRMVHDRSEKLSANYAKSFTSQQWELLTRGNSDPRDDVLLKKGQGWVTITSPVEGASYLTAMAPEAEAWDHRRQTVEIQWVDAQWTLPPPVSVRAGQVHELVTTVHRRSNGTPAENWIVIYEIVDGPPAQFAENGLRTVEVKTDGTGRARATIAPTTQEPGAARIRVHIVRPPTGQSPRFPIGQGMTSVAWSAAGLALRVQGPESVIAGSAVQFEIEVSNPGDQPARDVTVSAVAPPNLRIVSTAPPARALGERLQWDLGTLQGLERRRITVHGEIVRPGDILFQVQAQSTDGLQASESWQSRVDASALQVTVDGPRTGFVGGELPYRITVRNASSALLTNLVVYDTFGGGLRHKEGGVSPLENPRLGNLAPGESKQLELTFVALSPGQQCHQVRVVADGGHVAIEEVCAQIGDRGAATSAGVPPGGTGLQVVKTGPQRLVLGETQDYQIVIANNTQSTLTNVVVIDRYDPFVEPSEASSQFSVADGQLRWVVPQLPPGQRANMTVRCTAKEPRPGAFPVNQESIVAINRVLVSSDQGISGESQASTQVFRSGAADSTIPGGGSGGGLQVTKSGPAQMLLGETQDFTIVVTNNTSTTLTNVTVVDRYDPLVAPVSASSQFSVSAGELRWTVPQLAPGQRAQVVVRCMAQELTPGTFPAGQTSKTAINRVLAFSDQGLRHETQAVTEVMRGTSGAGPVAPPPPSSATLQVAKTGPTRMTLGETQDFFIVITNNTATTLTNVQVVDRYDPFLIPVSASGQFTVSGGELRWSISSIPPGQQAQLTIRCTAKEPSPGALPANQDRVTSVNRAIVTTAQGPQGESQVTTEVFREGGSSSTTPGAPGASVPPAAGGTQVSIASNANPARTGQQFSLVFVIANQRDASDQNVRLRIFLPSELQVQRASGPTAFRGAQGSILEFDAVRELRPGEALETMPYRVDVIASTSGDFRVRAEVISARNPQPLMQEKDIRVAP